MNFTLDIKELEKLNQWKKTLAEVPQEDLDVFGEKSLYRFTFEPTGLGNVITVEHKYYEEKIDLTNYDKW